MSTEDREVILSIKHVDVTFETGHKKKLRAVKDANFDIYKGETFALVGESGSGKTTLGRAIMRINPCSAGEILFEGKRISGKISREEDRNVVRNIQMIFQDPAASLNERATIEYCVSEGLYNFHLYKDENERIEKVDRALESVGLLPEHKSRYPHEFSGGQRQRVGIARAMIMDPKFIVADEPISALDVSIRAQVLNLMNKLKAERNLTYLFIAHDLSVVRFIADRIAVIHLGEIVEIAESETLFKYPMHPYTVSLLSAVPMPDPIVEKTRQPFRVLHEQRVRPVPGENGPDGAGARLKNKKEDQTVIGLIFFLCQFKRVHGNRRGLSSSGIEHIGDDDRRKQIHDPEEKRIIERAFALFTCAAPDSKPSCDRPPAVLKIVVADVKVAVQHQGIDDADDDQKKSDDGHRIRKDQKTVLLRPQCRGQRINERDDEMREEHRGTDVFHSFEHRLHLPGSEKERAARFLCFIEMARRGCLAFSS